MYIKIAIPQHFQLKLIANIRSMLLMKKGDIHYIGGAEILPPPLDAREENRYIQMLGEEDSEKARSVLIEHNLRLVVYIAKKFDNTGIGVEDLISIGTIGLIKAINTFNPAKNIKLATYASRCIENEILMYLRRNNKTRMEVSIDEPLNVDWDGNELLLSDILGTDEDIIFTARRRKAVGPGEDDCGIAFRTEKSRRRGDDAKRGSRSTGNFSIIYFQIGKKDNEAAEKRDCQV